MVVYFFPVWLGSISSPNITQPTRFFSWLNLLRSKISTNLATTHRHPLRPGHWGLVWLLNPPKYSKLSTLPGCLRNFDFQWITEHLRWMPCLQQVFLNKESYRNNLNLSFHLFIHLFLQCPKCLIRPQLPATSFWWIFEIRNGHKVFNDEIVFSTCCYILVCPTGKNNYDMLEIIFWPVKLTVRILNDDWKTTFLFGWYLSKGCISNTWGAYINNAYTEYNWYFQWICPFWVPRIFGVFVFHTNQVGVGARRHSEAHVSPGRFLRVGLLISCRSTNSIAPENGWLELFLTGCLIGILILVCYNTFKMG